MIKVYNSFGSLPLDEPGVDDVDTDTSPHQRTSKRGPCGVTKIAAGPGDYAIVVPYPGIWHEHDRSRVVHGIKRIVHRATGTLAVLAAAPPRQKELWGKFFTEKVKRAQRDAGIRVTGVWDIATHREFAPFADQYALTLIAGVPPTDVERRRQDVLSYLMAFYNRRWAIAYSQLRPTQLVPVKRIRKSDCSGSVAQAMNSAGVFPQVDWRWTNTDIQILFGSPVIRIAQTELADVPFYGRGSDPSHESCIVSLGDGNGHGVRVFSFGHFPAKLLPIDYRTDRIAIRRFI